MSEKIDFTPEQFRREVCELRNLWGQRDFWASEEKVELAQKAIGVMYLNTKCKDDKEQDEIAGVYMATMTEFTRREMYVRIGV